MVVANKSSRFDVRKKQLLVYSSLYVYAAVDDNEFALFRGSAGGVFSAAGQQQVVSDNEQLLILYYAFPQQLSLKPLMLLVELPREASSIIGGQSKCGSCCSWPQASSSSQRPWPV